MNDLTQTYERGRHIVLMIAVINVFLSIISGLPELSVLNLIFSTIVSVALYRGSRLAKYYFIAASVLICAVSLFAFITGALQGVSSSDILFVFAVLGCRVLCVIFLTADKNVNEFFAAKKQRTEIADVK